MRIILLPFWHMPTNKYKMISEKKSKKWFKSHMKFKGLYNYVKKSINITIYSPGMIFYFIDSVRLQFLRYITH